MKSRTVLIIVLIIVLIAVYYLLGTDYLKQRREGEALASQIAGTTQQLTLIPAPPDNLEQRLTDAENDLDATIDSIPQRLNSTQIINRILEIAEDTQVKALPLVTQDWVAKSYDEYSYSVFRINVVATGTFTRVSHFISRLETSELETLVIEHLLVEQESLLQRGEEEASQELAEVNASLQLAIYSRSSETDQPEKVEG